MPRSWQFHATPLLRTERLWIRHYLEQGTSKSALARQLGVSRDTIHRWVPEGDLDRDLDDEAVRYGPRPAVPTKLDPYKPIIEARLAAYPELSAVRLLDEIRAAGYAGGYTQLKVFVHLIDRLVHHCHLVTIRGNSYRMRQHSELWQTLHTAHEPETSGAGRRRRTPARQEATTT